jgi:GNAT superfamily N-acetyltransferase
MQNIQIRFAEEKDTPLILEFIRAIAEYERMSDQVAATEEGLRKYLFHDHVAEVIFAEDQDTPLGFSLFFHNMSTFVGRPGIYIEDIFVKPEFRGKGIGKALLGFIAGLAAERNCGRLEWSCLNWNEPSIAFYKSQGAQAMSGWTTFRVSGDALDKLAGQ